MEKYERMVCKNLQESREKISKAIVAIRQMEVSGEKVQVCKLTKKTGLSRAFFYKNPDVRRELETVYERQQGKVFVNPRKEILDEAMNRQLILLTQQVDKQKKQIANLEAENKKLKKSLHRKELDFVKNL